MDEVLSAEGYRIFSRIWSRAERAWGLVVISCGEGVIGESGCAMRCWEVFR